MDEAYNELYQEFLCLKSLCLKQAALLRQLTAALQKQGATVPNGESDMMSIPVQCTQEIPVCLLEKPQHLTAPAQHGFNKPSKNVGALSDLLAEDMSMLCVDLPGQRKDDDNLEQKVAPLLSMDSSKLLGASSSVSKNKCQADHFSGHRTMCTTVMPGSGGPTSPGDFPCPTGGMLMSDVVLHSHVCEFCQAVFPGDTTTRGEFLRHLYTHVT